MSQTKQRDKKKKKGHKPGRRSEKSHKLGRGIEKVTHKQGEVTIWGWGRSQTIRKGSLIVNKKSQCGEKCMIG